jgi:hypothetical protein
MRWTLICMEFRYDMTDNLQRAVLGIAQKAFE